MLFLNFIVLLLCPQNQSETAEKRIRQEFERLHEFLKKDEETRIQALKKEEEQKKQAITEKVESLDKDLIALKELIDTTRKEMGAEDLDFLLVQQIHMHNCK